MPAVVPDHGCQENKVTDFNITDWQAQLMQGRSGRMKEVLYKLARPLLNISVRRHLSKESLDHFRPDLVLPERGFPLATRRKWGSGFQSLAGKTILVQGVGNGWDVASWAEFRPDTIIGIDLFEFPSWPEVREYAAKEYGVKVEFKASPLHKLNFIADRSVDICASDAVFEHIDDMPAVMRETFRILKDEGLVPCPKRITYKSGNLSQATCI
ncbi:MAG TPA: class I SAM-dependent methyltransferase [Nitrospirae bacterium]|nr:class I SAM-dependent methyltransferase [Nitrospirota bacterium]